MRREVAGLTTVLGALAIASVIGQQDSVYVTLCHARFAVTNAQGRVVSDLTRDQVTVFDNEGPQQITDFTPHVHAPLNVAVVLDRSHSVGDRLDVLAQAATTFVTSVMHDQDDRGLVAAFDSKVYLLQDWTADPAQLVATIRRLTAAGGTALFDAVFKTCRDKFDPTDSRQNVLVLITDGEDTTSVATFDQALTMAKQSRAAIYVVASRAQSSLSTRDLQGHRVLARLAELTGGRVFYPSARHENDLGPVFATLEDELRNGYDLTYTLNLPPDNSFHRVRIEMRDKALMVHASAGYYAQRLSAP